MLDVLGMDLDIALEQLSSKGLTWLVEISTPPNKKNIEGHHKVIRQVYAEDKYVLTSCVVPDSFR